MIDMNNEEQVVSKLNELKGKNLPHMNAESLSTKNSTFKNILKGATKEELDAINKHLHEYIDDTDNEGSAKCIFTDSVPNLSWALRHGELIDSNTGLSWTGHHYFTVNGIKHKLERIMQYHPDAYELNE